MTSTPSSETAAVGGQHRGWTITWDYGFYTATSPDYDASYEGEEDGWVDNGQRVTARTRDGVIAEVDAWLEENAAKGDGSLSSGKCTCSGNDPWCDLCRSSERRIPTSREVMIAGGVDPDAPFEVGQFPAEMRQSAPANPPPAQLLPCPFCGSEAPQLRASTLHRQMSWVSCPACGLETPTETGTTDDMARTYWNTRAPSPERGELASLVEALEGIAAFARHRTVCDMKLRMGAQQCECGLADAHANLTVVREHRRLFAPTTALHALSASPEGHG